MSRKVAALIALALLATALGGCVIVRPDGQWQLSVTPQALPTSTVTVEGPSGGSAPAPAAPSRADASLPGTKLESGPWRVQVEQARMVSKLPDGTRASGGKQLMTVDLAFENNGFSAALLVFPKYVTLRDASGKTIKPVPTSLAAFNAQTVRPISSRTGQVTTMVYAIPKGSGSYVLSFAPGQGANKPMAWIVP
jgi:hypothetical protein